MQARCGRKLGGDASLRSDEGVVSTGASESVMSKAVHKRHFKNTELSAPEVTLYTVDGADIEQEGIFEAAVETDGVAAQIRSLVCPKIDGVYMSLKTCKRLYIVPEKFPNLSPKLIARIAKGESHKVAVTAPQAAAEMSKKKRQVA